MTGVTDYYSPFSLSLKIGDIVLAHDKTSGYYFTCSFYGSSDLSGDGYGNYLLPFIHEGQQKQIKVIIRRYRYNINGGTVGPYRFSVIAGCKVGTPPKLSKNLRDFINDIDPEIEARLDVQLMLEKEFGIVPVNPTKLPNRSPSSLIKLAPYKVRFVEGKQYNVVGWYKNLPVKDVYMFKDGKLKLSGAKIPELDLAEVKQLVKDLRMMVSVYPPETLYRDAILTTIKKHIYFNYTLDEYNALIPLLAASHRYDYDGLVSTFKKENSAEAPFFLLRMLLEYSSVEYKIIKHRKNISPITGEKHSFNTILDEFYDVYKLDKEVQGIYGVSLSDMLEMKRGTRSTVYDFILKYLNLILSEYVFYANYLDTGEKSTYSLVVRNKIGENLYKSGTGIPDISGITALYPEFEKMDYFKNKYVSIFNYSRNFHDKLDITHEALLRDYLVVSF